MLDCRDRMPCLRCVALTVSGPARAPRPITRPQWRSVSIRPFVHDCMPDALRTECLPSAPPHAPFAPPPPWPGLAWLPTDRPGRFGPRPVTFQAPDTRNSGAPPLVLLVEDFADTRELYVYYLSAHGFRVEEASTGPEGHHKALHLQPDVILMDLSLPGIDGWTLTRMLKADDRTRHVPVIAVTAHARPSDREQALEAGCIGFLGKPCSPRILVAEIARVLGDRPA